MILHVGGSYGDKEQAKERFIYAYNGLSSGIKDKLCLENDHTTFTIADVVDVQVCGVCLFALIFTTVNAIRQKNQ
jgi:UV DNA damage repair endonuclease